MSFFPRLFTSVVFTDSDRQFCNACKRLVSGNSIVLSTQALIVVATASFAPSSTYFWKSTSDTLSTPKLSFNAALAALRAANSFSGELPPEALKAAFMASWIFFLAPSSTNLCTSIMLTFSPRLFLSVSLMLMVRQALRAAFFASPVNAFVVCTHAAID